MQRLELSPNGLIKAYRQGIFPMADTDGRYLYWMRPDPRTILPLERFHVSRSLARLLQSGRYRVSFDTDFAGVMRACADREETWIAPEFIEVYDALHGMGCGHSVEIWSGDWLVGGLYGLAIGGAFMAESMFHRESNTSKIALAALVARLRDRGFALLDVQYQTPHLQSLGAIEISAAEYDVILRRALGMATSF